MPPIPANPTVGGGVFFPGRPATLAQWGTGQFWAELPSAALCFLLMPSELLVMLYLLSIKKRRAKEKEL